MVELSGVWQVFLGGALGGLLVELVKLGTSPEKIHVKYKRPGYWLVTLGLWFVSGVGAVVHGIEGVPLMRAVQLGIAAPALFSGMATASYARKQARKQRPKPAPYLPDDQVPIGAPTETVPETPTTLDLLGF